MRASVRRRVGACVLAAALTAPTLPAWGWACADREPAVLELDRRRALPRNPLLRVRTRAPFEARFAAQLSLWDPDRLAEPQTPYSARPNAARAQKPSTSRS